MSSELYRPGEPLSLDEQWALHSLQLDMLQDERSVHDLSVEKSGTSLAISTASGVLGFEVRSWGIGDDIEPNTKVFVKVSLGHELVGGFGNIAIVGASEGHLTSEDNRGKIKQFSDLIYEPFRMAPLDGSEPALGDEETSYAISRGDLICTPMGLLRVNYGEPRVLPIVRSMIRLGNSRQAIFMANH